MNAWTWHKCCEEAIESICDLGILYVCNEKTITRWHIFFWKNENFSNPRGYSKKLQEPKVFHFFPEIKSMINDFYGNPDNQPSMSAESDAAKIWQNILPKCYKNLLEEIDDVSNLPSYDELVYLKC
jgi:hypothetical protein